MARATTGAPLWPQTQNRSYKTLGQDALKMTHLVHEGRTLPTPTTTHHPPPQATRPLNSELLWKDRKGWPGKGLESVRRGEGELLGPDESQRAP